MKKELKRKIRKVKKELEKGSIHCFLCGKPAEILLDNFGAICANCMYKHKD